MFTDTKIQVRAQELCQSRGGRPGLHIPNSLCGRKAKLNFSMVQEY